MSAMMNISHRLFTAAVRDGGPDRKQRPRDGKPLVIEMPREMPRPVMPQRPMPAHGWSARISG